MIALSKKKVFDLEKKVEELIDVSIFEDIGSGDLTTDALIPEAAVTSGRLILKQAGTVAGLPFLATIFEKIDPKIEVTLYVDEGSYQIAGTIIAKISGPVRGILAGERLALNLLQHASGVATITAKYVKKVAGSDCAILDTRKTLPGLRALEKYAVRIGGGVNHRYSLDDRFIIKNNHLIFLMGTTRHPITDAVQKAKAANPDLPVEIEIASMSYLDEVLKTEADAIMLSRMTPFAIRKCVPKIKQAGKRVYVESLGTITLETIRHYAETGVDGISIGSITHSVQALEIGMRLAAYKR